MIFRAAPVSPRLTRQRPPSRRFPQPQDNATQIPPPSRSEDTSEERPLDLPTPAERAIRLGPVAGEMGFVVFLYLF